MNEPVKRWQDEGALGQIPGGPGVIRCLLCFSQLVVTVIAQQEKRKLGQRIRAQRGLRFNRILSGSK